MKKLRLLLVFTSLLTVGSSYALEVEHVLWEKTPLKIELPINKEQLIEFPQPIKLIDSPKTKKIAILKIRHRLYIKAKGSFNAARLIVQLLPAGEVVILNLESTKLFTNTSPIQIVTKESSLEKTNIFSSYEYNPILLTRFAIQSLYSPLRVRHIPPGVHRSPMNTHKSIKLFYGESIEAHPIASWRGNDLYITAIELKNLLNHPVTLSIDNLIGRWYTASFYPNIKLPKRNRHTSTTIFLVSNTPFQKALNNQENYSR